MSALFAASRCASLRVMRPQCSHIAAASLSLSRWYSSKFPPHTVINMPALSPTMTQGNIASWSKKEGDQLAPGEAIAEIETDKATMDFEFQEDGYLAKILMGDGSHDIPVGKPIAVYVEESNDVAAFENFTAEDAGEGEAKPAETKEEPKQESKEESKDTSKESKAAPAKSESKSSSTPKPSGRIIASPLAKTIALEKGISLKNVKGSGPNGRIVAKDLENIKESAAAAPAAAAAAAAPVGASYTDTPLTNMRKTIASRLLQSTQQSPSYIVSSEMSVSKLLKLRQSLNASAEDRYRLSVNDLLIKAIAKASLRVPEVNSAWLGEQGVIRTYNYVDVSVAVATPTGLITPIVKNADTKGLATISAEIKDLGKRAKANKLAPEEFQGGTVTLSNLGMNHAVTSFTSIINPPSCAIFAVGTVTKKAVPSDVNEQGFIFDDVMNITGTFDHRLVDGALGGEFMKALKKIVENPLEMLV
ncbi:hypothetical protein PGUG_00150 [Meyerozyma guilliermondii ATCC 6260]|uniref:Acetyltransferase component of pyruvate dehydrogenase complex n=1 Tax=Meyerozyma guilliermondii (strain ATCC 6260 / CBS 566 / DSM 6381 / JCM 1539 / NBRC 10279 / NRRL Y-324) TaxID=294746 RepID=A5DA45_PICGU|nr:uncharacterized protein PGUG_00150 [Meyerozyma guilliermondii ATCC 6260]EDK36052.2 hypothetical protein PGUG_00150 [Meyerozyma guilliermondii ATCC 6260]